MITDNEMRDYLKSKLIYEPKDLKRDYIFFRAFTGKGCLIKEDELSDLADEVDMSVNEVKAVVGKRMAELMKSFDETMHETYGHPAPWSEHKSISDFYPFKKEKEDK